MLITEKDFGIFKIVNVYFIEELVNSGIPNSNVVTYHSYENWENIIGYEKNKCLTTKINLNQDIDIIWKKIKRQHIRHIRRAEKNDIKIIKNYRYEEFHLIYNNFLKQKNFRRAFGLNLLSSKFMRKYGTLFIAEKQNEIIGGNYYVHDNYNAILIESAYRITENTTENKKQSLDASCYLHWQAMKYFKNKGIINYDLGEVDCIGLNINHQMNGGDYFKLSFGGDVIPRYYYTKFNNHFDKLLFRSWNLLRNNQ
jgi:hypothetical protein